MPQVGSILRPYRDARPEILDGDVAIWAPDFPGVWAKLGHYIRRPLHFGIQDASASRFIHAAMFGWCYGAGWHYDGRLLLAEFTQKKGGVLTLASSQIRGESGRWSVFRPMLTCPSRRHETKMLQRRAFANMIDITGTPYSMRTIWANLLRSLPIVRWFCGRRSDENDATTWGAATCSASVCQSLRLVGLDPNTGESWSDPVPNKSDYLVSPADLVHSPALRYLWTLTSEDL
jgi:hypothetical protein